MAHSHAVSTPLPALGALAFRLGSLTQKGSLMLLVHGVLGLLVGLVGLTVLPGVEAFACLLLYWWLVALAWLVNPPAARCPPVARRVQRFRYGRGGRLAR